jgi:hypothetical protein
MEVLHDSHTEKVLHDLEAAGGVVEHFLFAPSSTDNPHRAVAHACLEVLLRRNLPVWRRYPEDWNDFEITTVDWETFHQSIPLTLSHRDFLGAEFPEFPGFNSENPAYAYAILCPPHRLRGTEPEQLALLKQLCDALFGDLETLKIYAWPTDCSNYFDDGKDWWGTFFWTVYSPTYDWYIGILASATD